MERVHSGALQAWRQLTFSVDDMLPLIFTRHAFDLDKHHLRDLLSMREPHRRPAVLADAGVLAAMPQLAGQNDAKLLPYLLDIRSQRAIDRHSYLLAIGGARCAVRSATSPPFFIDRHARQLAAMSRHASRAR
ncbi:hypothetical protein AAKU55_001596 [Oxalobacteraceae bacterium GrIS 1.11]